jgi:hypothetical protein
MPERSQLKVEAEGQSIVVSLPGSSFQTTYVKSPKAPGLRQTEYMIDDKAAPMPRREFESMAWEAALAKAREFGWIT